jgi:hypothetical protein
VQLTGKVKQRGNIRKKLRIYWIMTHKLLARINEKGRSGIPERP